MTFFRCLCMFAFSFSHFLCMYMHMDMYMYMYMYMHMYFYLYLYMFCLGFRVKHFVTCIFVVGNKLVASFLLAYGKHVAHVQATSLLSIMCEATAAAAAATNKDESRRRSKIAIPFFI